MNERIRIALELTYLLLAVLVIVGLVTVATGVKFAHDCHANGGTFSSTSTVWNCTY